MERRGRKIRSYCFLEGETREVSLVKKRGTIRCCYQGCSKWWPDQYSDSEYLEGPRVLLTSIEAEVILVADCFTSKENGERKRGGK